MGIRTVVAAAVVLTAAGFAPALAADPAGTAVAVTPAAAANGATGARTLAVNGPVFMGDVVKTDTGSLAQLRFRDDTRMVVGPDSELTIDSFVLADQTTARKVTLNATRGVFRFITGNSPKPAYVIDTPIATIGVRGSHTDFVLPGDGTLSVVFYTDSGVAPEFNGGIYVCDKPGPGERRRCVNFTKECTFVTFASGKDPVFEQNAYDRAKKMDAIGFAFNRGIVGDDFRVNSGPCDSRAELLPRYNPTDDSQPIEHAQTPPSEGGGDEGGNGGDGGDGGDSGGCDGECR